MIATLYDNAPGLLAGIAAAGLTYGVYGAASAAAARFGREQMARTQADFGDVFLFISSYQLLNLSLAVSLSAGMGIWLALGSLVYAAAVALMALCLPNLVVRRLRTRRVKRLERQLPDCLRAMASALRAGASLPAVLRHLAVSASAPLGQELALVLRQQRVGIPFGDAMRNMEQRLASEAVKLLTSSLRIAGRAGGDLSIMLERVAITIQRRQQVEERVRTLTAQGRLQAVVMGALPVLLLVALNVLAPEEMAPLWDTPAGWVTLGALAILETMGMLTIRRIVSIDV